MKKKSVKRAAAALLAIGLAAQMNVPAFAVEASTPGGEPAAAAENSRLELQLNTAGGTVETDSFGNGEGAFWSAAENGYRFAADADSVVLPDCQRTGYQFKGWKLAESETVLKAGDTVTKAALASAESAAPVLSAQWQPVLVLDTVDAQTDKTELAIGDQAELTAKVKLSEDTESAFGNQVELEYQWLECKNENGSDPVPIDGAKEAVLKTSATVGEHFYACKVIASMEGAEPVEMVSKTVAVKVTPVQYAFQFKDKELTKSVDEGVFQLEWSVLKDGAEATLPDTAQMRFTSDNESVATVADKGQVTIHGVGKANLSVHLSDETGASVYPEEDAVATLNVKNAQTIQFAESEITANCGAEPIENAITGAVTEVAYTSSDEAVAKIVDGKISIAGAGTAIITATAAETDEYLGATAECKITVNKVSQTLTFAQSEVNITFGTDPDENTVTGASSDLTYKSSNEDVATVDESGKVTVVGSGSATITAVAAETDKYSSGSAEYKLTVKNADMTGLAVIGYSGIYDGKAHDAVIVTGTKNGDTVLYSTDDGNSWTESIPQVNEVQAANDLAVKVKVSRKNHNDYISDAVSPKVEKASVDMSDIEFKDGTVTYDGSVHSLAISGKLPEGVTVSYEGNGNVNAGTYRVIAVFHTSSNYKGVPKMIATQKIEQAVYDMSDVRLESETVTYDGHEHHLSLSGKLPDGVSAILSGGGKSDVGEYTIEASFIGSENYKPIPDITGTLKIVKGTYDMGDVQFSGDTVTYDGKSHSVAVSGKLPSGVSVSYEGNGKTDAGTYEVTAKFHGSSNYNEIPDKTATLVINKADYDLSKIKLNDKTFVYDGTEKKLQLDGSLPEGVKAEYENNSQTNAGESEVKVKFVGSENYNAIPDLTAKIIIQKQAAKISVQPLTAGAVFGGRSIKLGYQYIGTGAVTASADGNAKVEVDTQGKVITITPAANGRINLRINAAESENFTEANTVYSVNVDKISTAITANINGAKIRVEQNGQEVKPNGTHYVLQFGKSFTYTASAPGYVTEMKSLLATSPSYEVKLRPAEFDVKFNTGNARSVQIDVKDKNGKTMEADGDGVYHLTYGDTYDYTISAPGMKTKSGELTVSGNSTVNIRLDSEAPTVVKVDPNLAPAEDTTDLGAEPAVENGPADVVVANPEDATELERDAALEAVEEKAEELTETPTEGQTTGSQVPDDVTRTSSAPVIAKVLAVIGLVAAVICGAFAFLTTRLKHESKFDERIAAAKAANADTQQFEVVQDNQDIVDGDR